MLLTNAFSLNMLPQDGRIFVLDVRRRTLDEVRDRVQNHEFVSAVCHAETAAVLSQQLGVSVPHIRLTILLSPDYDVIVAQYVGPRLPEGATSLPDGARIDFFLVRLLPS